MKIFVNTKPSAIVKQTFNFSFSNRMTWNVLLLLYHNLFPASVTTESVCVFLNTTGKKQWKERDKKEVVVLVDEGSTAEGLAELSDSVPILALKDAITKVRGGCILVPRPLCMFRLLLSPGASSYRD